MCHLLTTETSKEFCFLRADDCCLLVDWVYLCSSNMQNVGRRTAMKAACDHTAFNTKRQGGGKKKELFIAAPVENDRSRLWMELCASE